MDIDATAALPWLMIVYLCPILGARVLAAEIAEKFVEVLIR